MDKTLNTINLMIANCEPIKYDDFNKFIKAKDSKELVRLESKYPEIGICSNRIKLEEETDDDIEWGITTLSLISTITDTICGKRLAFNIDDNGIITGATWFNAENKDGETPG